MQDGIETIDGDKESGGRPADAGQPEAVAPYRVSLEAYAGPLDLLLYLVKKEEVDITDVSLARVADQYMEYLDLFRNIDIEAAGDFLVVAATLTDLKSRFLLPAPEIEEESITVDPGADLVTQLLAYRDIKEAAAVLNEKAAEREEKFDRLADDLHEIAAEAGVPADDSGEALKEVTLWDLMSAFSRIIAQTKARAPLVIAETAVPVAGYMNEIRERLRSGTPEFFDDLFGGGAGHGNARGRIIGLFIALLELVKEGKVFAAESENGRIRLFLRTGGNGVLGAYDGEETAGC